MPAASCGPFPLRPPDSAGRTPGAGPDFGGLPVAAKNRRWAVCAAAYFPRSVKSASRLECSFEAAHFGVELPGKFGFPFVKQGPVNGTGPEIGHVLIFFEPVDRRLQLSIVFAENGAVAGEQPLDVAVANAFQRGDKCGDVGTMVCVDVSHATVPEDVVA